MPTFDLRRSNYNCLLFIECLLNLTHRIREVVGVTTPVFDVRTKAVSNVGLVERHNRSVNTVLIVVSS